MKILPLVLSALLVTGCATTGNYSYAGKDDDSSIHSSEGVHWGWWLVGVIAVGLALSAADSGSNSECDRKYPYTRSDGIKVVGNINCIGF